MNTGRRIYDITRPIAPGIWVWPGDRAFEQGTTFRRAEGASVNVAYFTMSCQTGTHIDAPYHFSDRGPTSEQIPLAACLGPCLVVPLAQFDSTVEAERVLLKAEGGVLQADQVRRHPGLLLLGTDHVSVDAMDSKTLDVHHALWQRGAVILEGLDLSAVPVGAYQLCALPLKVVGLDGAPTRAILVET
jgi:arylformamidase